MATASKPFPTEKITEKNQLEALKRVNNAVIKVTDKGLDRDLRVLTELQEIKQEQHETNQRLDKVEDRLMSVETTLNNGFQELTNKFDQLDQGQNRMIELLGMIAENTKRD